MRNAISDFDCTRTNSTFVPCGNSGLVLILAPSSCQRSPCALKSSLSTNNTKCGFPTCPIAPTTSPTPSTTIVRCITRGTPISLSIRYTGSLSSTTRQRLGPPCVPSTTSSIPSLEASQAATQRVPFPESSASLPSALNNLKNSSPFG